MIAPVPEAARRHLEELVHEGAVPGIQYVAVTATDVLCEYAGGWADIAQQRAMTPATTLMAYSMSKTITAVAALQLVESGKLSLDEPLDGWQPYGDAVTVRRLLAHTAGIPSPLPLRWVHPAAAHHDFDESAALTKVLREHPTVSSTPGQRFRYSNIGYWLLGPAIERASGLSFREYVKTRVLDRLDVAPTELGFDVADTSQHAAGYLERYSMFNLLKGLLIDRSLIGATTGSWVHIRDHYVNGAAFGGLVGTGRAFGRFLQDQLSSRSVLLNEASRRLLAEPQHTTGGREVPMTLGWHVGRRDGAPFFYKEGGGGGFHCLMRIYPATGIGTVLMTNATGINVTRVLDALDGSFRAAVSVPREH